MHDHKYWELVNAGLLREAELWANR